MASSEDDRTGGPDHTEDTRRQDTGQGGYPEANPEGARDDDAADGPQTKRSDGGDTRAPSTANAKEGDRAASTGNPHAAG